MAKSRSRKNPKRLGSEHVYYILEISSWKWSLSFGVAHDPQRGSDPYDDYRHLAIRARFRRPERLKDRAIELTFIPDPDLDRDRRQNDRPPQIGSISLYREAQGILSLPADALPSLLPMLIGEKFRYVVLHGTRLRYQKASVHSFRFEMQINEDDWPSGD